MLVQVNKQTFLEPTLTKPARLTPKQVKALRPARIVGVLIRNKEIRAAAIAAERTSK